MSNVLTICPDGVNINIPLDGFVCGSSIFVPCVNTIAAKKNIKKAYDTADVKLVFRVCVDNNGRHGLRVWRKS